MSNRHSRGETFQYDHRLIVLTQGADYQILQAALQSASSTLAQDLASLIALGFTTYLRSSFLEAAVQPSAPPNLKGSD